MYDCLLIYPTLGDKFLLMVQIIIVNSLRNTGDQSGIVCITLLRIHQEDRQRIVRTVRQHAESHIVVSYLHPIFISFGTP